MTSSTAAGTSPPTMLGTAIGGLPPASFAFVMATGIVSTGIYSWGPRWMSTFFFGAAVAGLLVLGVALILRVVLYFPRIINDVRAAERVFGFFTLVAGLDVLAARFDVAGHPAMTAAFAVIAAAVWLFLTYAIPASLLLTRKADSVLGGINGTWLLWVVATQSLSIAASVLVHAWPTQSGVLAPASVILWGIGLVLYLTLVALIFLRWLTVPMKPDVLGPPYWILMGATAISVLAGARILTLPSYLPVRAVTGDTIAGISFILWSFGTWWVPLLVVLGLWRHIAHRWPLKYETALWSIVFPLGMYSVATLAFGKVEHLSFMQPIARVMIVIAVCAWTAVASGLVIGVVRFFLDRSRKEATMSVGEVPAS